MADDQFKAVETSILQKIELISESSFQHSVYEVPEYVRNVNKKCYAPLVVSIGPVYYKNPALEEFQKIKLAYLKSFLDLIQRYGYGLQEFFNVIKGWEEKARACYQHKIDLSSDEFIEMVMVDAAFIISIFMYTGNLIQDVYYVGRQVVCQLERDSFCIQLDLFLAENQLPFFVLNDLFNQVFRTVHQQNFRELSLTCIIGEKASSTIRKRVEEVSNIEHLVDFWRICHLPSHVSPSKDARIRCHLSAKELRAAGVKFAASESENLLDITFLKGVLNIPKFVFDDSTEALYRNILWFEQSHCFYKSSFTDYVCFLDNLIDTAEDVQILVRNNIIDNQLGSVEELTTAINSLEKHLVCFPPDYYNDISRGLNAYTSKKWNKWKAILRRDYFNHPWSVISVIYLVILLILTVLQVYTGFRQLK